jgi:putative ABC transport system substrate-binding protein
MRLVMRPITVSVLIAALLLTISISEAQQSKKVPQVAYLSLNSRQSQNADLYTAFLQGLHQLGYIENKNVMIQARWADQNVDRLSALAAELVSLNVDVIVAGSPQSALAAKKATTTIPIVLAVGNDPVELGLISNLAWPGGNITGLGSLPGTGLIGKRLEVLKETFPKVTRVAVLWNPENPASVSSMKATETPAQSLGIKIQSVEMRQRSDLEQAFTAMKREGAEALLTMNSPMVGSQMQRIVDLATSNRLVGMYSESRWTDAGGLMSYGANFADLYRRAATFVDKILKGTKPADLPVEQPTKFELVINLKTAKQIGLTIPPTVLARADRIIK